MVRAICASPSPLPQAALVSKLVLLTKGGTRGLQNNNSFSLIGSPAARLCTHSLVQSWTLTPVMPFWKYKGFVLQNDNSFSPAAHLCTHWSSVGHSHQLCHSGSTRSLYYRMTTAFPSCAPQLPAYALIGPVRDTHTVLPFWKYKGSVLQNDNSFSLMRSPAARLSTH